MSSHQDCLALLLVMPANVEISLLCQGTAGHPLARGEGDAGGRGVVSTTQFSPPASVAKPLIR